MNKCCIIDNEKAPIFQSNSGTLILSECTIGEGQFNSTQGTVKGSGVPSSFINKLTFIKTGSCVNIIDTLGDLIPSNMLKSSRKRVAKCFYNLFLILSLFICICFS